MKRESVYASRGDVLNTACPGDSPLDEPLGIHRIPHCDPDILLRRRQRSGLRGYLHRPRAAKDRQSLPGLAGRRRPLRRWAGDDLCRNQRSPRLLDLRTMVL